MKYVALLRGINVGGNRKVEMKRLKWLFESLGCENVTTYINSGNVIFDFAGRKEGLLDKIARAMKKEFGFEIQTLLLTHAQIKKIMKQIPEQWENDKEQKTDVAFLFPKIDSKETIEELPWKKEYIDIRYVKGALIWNVKRENYSKSHLNKIISHKYYKLMTLRNVNTARYLARDDQMKK